MSKRVSGTVDVVSSVQSIKEYGINYQLPAGTKDVAEIRQNTIYAYDDDLAEGLHFRKVLTVTDDELVLDLYNGEFEDANGIQNLDDPFGNSIKFDTVDSILVKATAPVAVSPDTVDGWTGLFSGSVVGKTVLISCDAGLGGDVVSGNSRVNILGSPTVASDVVVEVIVLGSLESSSSSSSSSA